MADSIDRVFSKAVTTIKTLSTRSGYGSLPRPPLETRIKLYGLYKQATEGNISVNVLNSATADLSSIEDEIILKKYDSWKSNLNLSQTDAKKKYIEVLIDTMKVYASGTVESRELLNELEYLYDQIKNIPDDELEAGEDLKSPDLLYHPQFQYPDQQAKLLRNLSQSTNNLIDMRSIYDKNDSIYSFHHTGGGSGDAINSNWKHEINAVINKMIRDLNFFKKLERQRILELENVKKYKLIKNVLKLLGYSLFNIVVIILLLKFNKKKKFLSL